MDTCYWKENDNISQEHSVPNHKSSSLQSIFINMPISNMLTGSVAQNKQLQHSVSCAFSAGSRCTVETSFLNCSQ